MKVILIDKTVENDKLSHSGRKNDALIHKNILEKIYNEDILLDISSLINLITINPDLVLIHSTDIQDNKDRFNTVLKELPSGIYVGLFSGAGNPGTDIIYAENVNKFSWYFTTNWIDLIENLPKENWPTSPEDFKKLTEKISGKQDKDLLKLNGLNILIEGYLTIWNPEIILGDNFKAKMEKLNILQGLNKLKLAKEKTCFKHCPKGIDQRIFRLKHIEIKNYEIEEQSSSDDEGWYLLDECLPDIRGLSIKNLKKQDEIKDSKNLLLLIEIIQGISFQKNDYSIDRLKDAYPTQEKLTDFLAAAHNEYLSLFDEKTEYRRSGENSHT